MNQMMLALIVASNLVVIFTRAAASANRVNEVLTVESQLTDTQNQQKQVASVPQTAVLFTGTIRENLQWGKPNATDEDCWEALAIAQCKEFVEQLDQGLDTPVNEGGKTFLVDKDNG